MNAANEAARVIRGATEPPPTPTMVLHDAGRLGDAMDAHFSIQRLDERGDPVGVVCLFDVPPRGKAEDGRPAYDERERQEATAIFNAVHAHDDLLAACKAQHQAIDILMAMLIERDKTFRPSTSEVWPMLLQGNAAIAKAEGRS